MTREARKLYQRKYRLDHPEYYKRYRERHQEYKNTQAYRFSRYKATAKHRKLAWDITKEQFLSFWQKPCAYCGRTIETIGLDRIDSTIGYLLDNLIPCCGNCNRMKSDLSQQDFLSYCTKITQHFNSSKSEISL